MIEHVEFLVAHYGYGAVFVLLGLGIVGLPVPDESLLTLTGFLVYKGEMRIVPACISAFLGTISGITLSYVIGRTGGFPLVHRYGSFFHITEGQLENVRGWFARSGKWALTLGYFLPGVRHLTALVAGATHVGLPTFAVFAYSGGLIWSIVFVSAGYLAGKDWHRFSAETHWILSLVVIAIAVLITGYILFRRLHRGQVRN